MIYRASTEGRGLPSRALLAAFAVGVVCAAEPALAYVGPSFMQIPNIHGGSKSAQFKDWVKINANLWPGAGGGAFGGGRPGGGGAGGGAGAAGGGGRGGGAVGGATNIPDGATQPRAPYVGAIVPLKGKGEVIISVDKKSPAFKKLMALCKQKTVIPEVTYAESSERERNSLSLGARPANVPEYLEYKLKGVHFSDCPEVPDAPEQAIFVDFDDVQWLNFDRTTQPVYTVSAAELAPKETSGKTKTFALTWFAAANDVSNDQCPVQNKRPVEDDYYALMSTEDADKERAALKGQGGVEYHDGQMGHRGPRKLDATMLPGLVRDPGHALAQTQIARGLDLDGNDGTGKTPAGVCKHKNYTSPDGRTGIDNQFYTVAGCVAGWQGHNGFIMQYNNTTRHDGATPMLIEISGIDNEQNDDSVTITWLYSRDPMVKSAVGGSMLPDYTFRLAENPWFTYYFSRTHGRIVNGVVISDPIKEFRLNLGGISGTPPELDLFQARMRLEITPEGNLKGILGGYMDWQRFASVHTSSNWENYFGYQAPAFYNALRREADGLKDPLTGECNGISTAFDIEGIPAFISPTGPQPSMQAAAQARTAN
jgi:hypothetical protein